MYKITQNITGTFGLSFILVCMLLLAGCKGPTGDNGSKGSKGAQGEQGPVGPAGEDGSVMYSGKDAPSTETGDEGDYYLNNSTGELYGPKGSDGWPDNPSIVLLGDQGPKGEKGDQGDEGPEGDKGDQGDKGDTGPQGADGKDGTKIYSGTAAPASSKGVLGDYFLDEVNYDVYGPKTSSGWGTPINIKGADGNANVTRYIFSGNDFTTNPSPTYTISPITNQEFKESAWFVYLADDRGLTNSTYRYYPVPGPGKFQGSSYSVSFGGINDSKAVIFLESSGSPKANYVQIEVIQIRASNTIDKTKIKDTNAIVPEGLDVSDYQSVANYYGFGNN